MDVCPFCCVVDVVVEFRASRVESCKGERKAGENEATSSEIQHVGNLLIKISFKLI